MIGKITTGTSFSSCCGYVLKQDKKEPSRIVGGNVGGSDPASLEKEFEYFAKQNNRVKSPVKHISLSFAPEDGKIEDCVKAFIALEYMEKMGYGNCQFLVVSHSRSDHNHDHDHIHIVANTVDLDGKWITNFNERWRSQEVLRELEREHNLTPVLNSWDKNRDRTTVKIADRRTERIYHRTESGDIADIKADIQNKIDRCAPSATTITQFCARLQSLGVEPIPRITRTGKVQGLSYKQDEVVIRGTDLIDASFPALQSTHQIGYSEKQDLTNLKLLLRGGVLEVDRDWIENPMVSFSTECDRMVSFSTECDPVESHRQVEIDNSWSR